MGTKETKKEVLRIVNKIKAIAKGGRANQIEYNQFVDEIIRNGETEFFTQCLSTVYSFDTIGYKGLQELKVRSWERILEKTPSDFVDSLSNIYAQKQVFQQAYEIRSTEGSFSRVELSPTLSDSLAVVATASKVSLSNAGDTLTLSMADPKIYSARVYQVDWATYSVAPSTPRQLVSYTGTASSIDSQIPTEHGGVYKIEVEKKDPYGKFIYRVSVVRDDLLGTITEEDALEFQDTNYYNYSKAVREALGQKRTYLLVDRVDGQKAAFTNYDPKLSEEENLLNRYRLAIDYLKQ